MEQGSVACVVPYKFILGLNSRKTGQTLVACLLYTQLNLFTSYILLTDVTNLRVYIANKTTSLISEMSRLLWSSSYLQ